MPPHDQPAWVLTQRRATGDRIRELRSRRGLSQEQLAHQAGVDRKTVHRMEQATYNVGVDAYLLVAEVLGVQPALLFPDRPR
jgi:transcriptional regulator with XRE-family HTH domain